MSDEITPKLGLTKPDVGASDDTWGSKLNHNFDILDGVENVLEAPSDGVNYGRKNHAWAPIVLSSGVPEAPVDSTLYGRKNSAWVAVPPPGILDAPSDSLLYGRKNAAWFTIATFPEAPNDTQLYGRKSLGWAVIPPPGITDAPSDSTLYGRRNGGWTNVPSSGISDAPSDGSAYERKNAGWVVVNTKNYILNGAMMISQENGSAPGTTTAYYAVDQFFSSFGNGGATSFAQVASVTPGGSPNRIRYTVTAADATVAAGDLAMIVTRIEGLRCADLLLGTASAKTTTLRFGCKGPAGTYCAVFLNQANNRSYVAEYVISGGEANTDVVKSVTIPGDTSGTWLKDTSAGLEVRWGLMAGSTYQQAAGSWGTGNAVGSANQFNLMGTNGNVFELFDVGIYVGSVAPTFVVPDYAQELRTCQRYFQRMGGAANNFAVQGYAAAAGNAISMPIVYPVSLRAPPSVITLPTMTNTNSPGAGTTGIGELGFLLYATGTAAGFVSSTNAGAGYVMINARM